MHAGEIVGLAGVEGNGQAELLQTLVGLRFPERGDILLDGWTITREGTGLAANTG